MREHEGGPRTGIAGGKFLLRKLLRTGVEDKEPERIGAMMNDIDSLFPAEEFPAEPRLQRLLGLYGMKGDNLYMQRIKVHAGRITPRQLKTIGRLARQYTPGYPLHSTTRQDFELHGVREQDVPAIHEALDSAGMTAVGACGDTLRNVAACPCSGLCKNSRDVLEAASEIRRCSESLPFIRSMPRKFKISISGCSSACGRPYVQDIGLIARYDGRFNAVVAGSLGARPNTGIRWPGTLKAGEAVAFVIAALYLFDQEGDRENRRRARLRHVRERLGDEVFLHRLNELFEKEKTKGWPPARSYKTQSSSKLLARFTLPLGDIPAAAAIALANAAEAGDAQIIVGIEHDLLIYGERDIAIPRTLEKRITGEGSLISCPGSTWCQQGIADSRAVGAQLDSLLRSGSSLRCAVSGCPNGCSHPAVADIGLVGMIRNIDGVRMDCFKLLAGGDNGTGPGLSVELHPAVPADKVRRVVEWLTEQFEAGRKEKEKFSRFARRRHSMLKTGIVRLLQAGLQE